MSTHLVKPSPIESSKNRDGDRVRDLLTATYRLLLIAALAPVVACASAVVGFTNGGFETGDLTGWTVHYWLNKTGIPSLVATPARTPIVFTDLNLMADSNNGSATAMSTTTQTYTGVVPTGTITSPDALTLNNLTFPLYGNYSAIVNQLAASANAASRATSLSQTGVMSTSDVDSSDGKIHIRFDFAGVVELPTHTADQQPYIFVQVQDVTKGTTLYSHFAYAGEPGAGWLAGAPVSGSIGPWYYLGWKAVDVAPGAGLLDVGDSVQITVVASACVPGKHEAYVYVDGGMSDTALQSPTVTASGPANANPGDQITYTYSYANPLGSAVASVQVAATLPPDTTFVSTTGSGCTTPSVGGTGSVVCPIGTLAANSSGSFDIVVTISGSATFPINNGVYQISGTGVPTLTGPLLETLRTPQYTLTGPSTGVTNAAATFTLTPTAAISSTITVTPSGGGLSTPIVKTFSASSAPQSFTITPTATGTVTLNPVSASTSLQDPPVAEYTVFAGIYTLTGPASGVANAASGTFTVTPANAITGTITITPSGGGLSTPITLTFSNSSAAQTFTITPTATGTVTLTPSNSLSLLDPGSLTYTSLAAATTYTFSGPAGGALNTASANFTVTPDGVYSGTVTLTPAGGGLSTPVVLTFSSSSVAQTFTITPTAVGPVTLTATNNGSLTDAEALNYATPSSAPTIGAVAPGNGSLSVAFSAPVNSGGSMITGYTVTCGSQTGSGSSSPITVSSLSNGTAYTCTVIAVNGAGASAPSSASSAATPAAPAAAYTFAGPAGGALNTASSNFTVTPNGLYSGTVTITPSGGGLSSAIVLTFSNSFAAQTFTITPTAVGAVTLTAGNNGSLTNPGALMYATPPGAPTSAAASAGNGSATVTFTAPGNTGGSIITGYTVTCGSQTASGSASPITVSGLSNGTSYSCTVTATNAAGTSAASGAANSVTPVAPASSFTLTGPSGGAVNAVSSAFTVTPSSVYTGTITITPSGGGLSVAITLTFNNSAVAQTFTVSPTTFGPVTLTAANNGSLSNPTALTYATPPDAPTIGTAAVGNGSATVSFSAPGADGGSLVTGYTANCGGFTAMGTSSPITVSGLSNGMAYTCSVTATNGIGTSAASDASNSVTPAAPADSYALTGPSGGAVNSVSGAFTVTPDSTYTGTITITPSGGGLSTPIVLTFSGSAVAQTLTLTPTTFGPVTLTPSNSGSLSDPTALTYSTPSDAPTIGTAIAGNGSATVSFTAPPANGGSIITGYTVNCGGVTALGTNSPITVSGLTNGMAYTCAVTATNGTGTSAASANSNSVTPVAPASSFTLTGPSGGAVNTASTAFTVTPSASYTGEIAITPSGGGVSTTIILSFNGSAIAQTFTITPTTFGPVTLSPSNSGSLSNPTALTYATPSDSPAIGTASAANGSITVSFSAPSANGGSMVTGYTVDCGGFTATGSASPITVSGLTNGTPYACTVTATNGIGTSAASASWNPLTPVAPANSFALNGPAGGSVGATSAAFSVTPNSAFIGTITITPSGGGLSAPIVLTFNNSSAAQTFSITPLAAGPIALMATNSGTLANPTALTYATPPGAPAIGSASAGNASVTVSFTGPSSNGGSMITGYTVSCGGHTSSGSSSPITVSGLTNGTPYTCEVTATNAIGTSPGSGLSIAVTPFALASAFTLSGPGGGPLNAVSAAFVVTPNGPFSGIIVLALSGGGLFSSIPLNFNNSSAAQTFSIAPMATGPVVVTPSNNGTLMNPAAITYATPPSPPAFSSTTAGNGSATIEFTAPISDGGSAILVYTANCGGVVVTGNGSPLTVSGLTNGTAYSCSLTATNSFGTSQASSSSAFVPRGVPGAPVSVTAVAGNAMASVSFSAPASDGGSPVTSYTVSASPGGKTQIAAASPAAVTGLTNGTAYTFSVSATNSGGTGPSATSNSVTPMGPPGAPLNVTASAGDGQAAINFSPPASNGGASISSYTVTSAPGGFTATGSASPIAIAGLTDGTGYTFFVTATNLAGTGPASQASNSVTPQAGTVPLTVVLPSTFPVGVVGIDYPLQILTAAGGAGPYTFSIGSGSLPPGLTFSSPQFSGIPTSAALYQFTITVTDSAGGTASGNGSILIDPAAPDLILSQSTVDFGLTTGSQSVPTPASVTVRSSDIEQLLNYAVSVFPAAPWLDVLGGGTTPGAIQIALDSSALNLAATADGYQTTVTATCIAPSPCAGKTKTIVVSLNVSSPAPNITFTSGVLSFDAIASQTSPLSQVVGIQNSGGGILSINSFSAADSWLSIANVPTTLAAGAPVPVTITANPAGLAAGYYLNSVQLATSAGPISLPVNLRVAAHTTIQLAPLGSQFQTTPGAPLGNPNGSFLISVEGGSVNFSASVIAGSPWLHLTTTEGIASAAQPGIVNFAIDPAAQAISTAQTYYGAIRISSSEVVNSPLDFEVVLNVLPAASPVKPQPFPAGLVFAPAQGVLTAAGAVQVYASSSETLPYQASVSTLDGTAWLTVLPATGVASAASPGQSAVSVDATGLAPGVYRGGVSYAFSSAAVRTVNVTLVIGAPGPGAKSAQPQTAQTSCDPTQIIATQTGLVDNFQQPAGWPVGLAIQLITDCGAAVGAAEVTASFSNGDDPVQLMAVDSVSGIFAGTWVPDSVSPQVTVTTTASVPGSQSAAARITGQVTFNSAPIIAPNAVLNIFRADIGLPLAPGSIIQIYGSNLALATASASNAPLPTILGSTSVLIGGISAPLYYVSAGQINAQIPFELMPGNEYQIQVMVNGAMSAAESVALVNVAPGVAADDSNAAIAQHADYTLVSAAAPVKPGETIILYLAGLGATDVAVANGAASPAGPLAHPVDVPTVTVNGNPAQIAFAGLTPGSVGLYQINLVIPSDLANGNASIIVTQGGFRSNLATLPVHN